MTKEVKEKVETFWKENKFYLGMIAGGAVMLGTMLLKKKIFETPSANGKVQLAIGSTEPGESGDFYIELRKVNRFGKVFDAIGMQERAELRDEIVGDIDHAIAAKKRQQEEK